MVTIRSLMVFLGLSLPAFSATLHFGGNVRAETAMFQNLGLDTTNASKSYTAVRALLQPNLVIDDHFTIHSQWNIITSGNYTPNATTQLGAGQGGYLLGDNGASVFQVGRLWFDWTSDFGVLRVGRVPVSWGYGLVYDAGDRLWDDFQTTFDRVEYQLHLGYVLGGLSFSKNDKDSVFGNNDDNDFYGIYLRYTNPETELETGVLYEKQVRSNSQESELTAADGAAAERSGVYGSAVAYPLSNDFLDAYLKKTLGQFTFGAEIGWITGTALNYDGDGTSDTVNAFGLTGTVSYNLEKIKMFVEFLYAAGDDSFSSDDHLSGFVLLNRNRRAGLILGRELLGSFNGSHGNSAGKGSLVTYGAAGTFSGVLLFRPGVRVDWSRSWTTGLEVIIANTVAPSSSLGVEIDIGVEHSIQKNADLGLQLGILIPGSGLGVSNPLSPYALRLTLGVTL